MTKEVRHAKVYLWGTLVGDVYLNNNNICQFEYDKSFIDMGINVSPIKMPLTRNIYSFPDLDFNTFKGLPGLLYDSLPDKFGEAVLNKWLLSIGRNPNTYNVIERLCYIGKRGMGALEYVPELKLNDDKSEKLSIESLSNLANEVLKNKESMKLSYKNIDEAQLLKFGTSAGGTRAKAIIAYNKKTKDIRSGQVDAGEGYEYYIVKFDGIEKSGDRDERDLPEYTKIEYAYYKMAKDAGISINESMLLEIGESKHFMTKRFDRYIFNGKLQKIHMQTLSAIAHIDYNIPMICSYEGLARYAKILQLDYSDIEEIYRRMVFNVLAVNCDDHVKNFSFLMDRDGDWRLSPAYDVTFAYHSSNKWLGAHQMTINGKNENITLNDLLNCGITIDIKKSRCFEIIENVKKAVGKWEDYANTVGISKKNIELIHKEIGKREVFKNT